MPSRPLVSELRPLLDSIRCGPHPPRWIESERGYTAYGSSQGAARPGETGLALTLDLFLECVPIVLYTLCDATKK